MVEITKTASSDISGFIELIYIAFERLEEGIYFLSYARRFFDNPNR